MKRKLLIQQYEKVRESIVANVEIITKLVDQADSLTELANAIKEKDPKNENLLKDIESQIADLKDSITDLIKQTGKLFDSYSAFADEVFDN
jgi:septal ring factor EnvC (AmiA/AmiB activator)